MKHFVIFLSFFILLACGKNQVSHQYISSDFLFSYTNKETLAKHLSMASLNQTDDCTTHIKKIICLSNSTDRGYDPECDFSKAGEDIKDQIVSLIQTFPNFEQKIMCHLNLLQIHENIESIGYATIVNDSNGSLGTLIGIRKSALRSNHGPDVFSWKEQLNFNLSSKEDKTFKVDYQGPIVKIDISKTDNTSLLYVMIHEVGHIIDFLNQVYTQKCARKTKGSESYTECTFPKKSFATLSWPNPYTFSKFNSSWPPPEFQEKYPFLSKMCFYQCSDFISIKDSELVYSELAKSSFVTTYSATSPSEDFAEANTIYLLMTEDFGFNYQIIEESKILFSEDVHWKSIYLKSKIEWLKNFYLKPDLKYSL